MKIKPCPFCGSKAKIECVENVSGEGKFNIFCINWRCISTTKPFSIRDEAIKAWNRRVPPKTITKDML